MKTGFVIMNIDFAYDDNFYYDNETSSPHRIIFNREEAEKTKNQLNLEEFKKSLFDYDNNSISLFEYQHVNEADFYQFNNNFSQKYFQLPFHKFCNSLRQEINNYKDYFRGLKYQQMNINKHMVYDSASPTSPILDKMKTMSDQELEELRSIFELEFYTIAEVEIQHVLA